MRKRSMTNSVFFNQATTYRKYKMHIMMKWLPFALYGVVLLVLSIKPASAACKGVGCACEPSIIQFASPVMQPGTDGKFPISLEADDVEAQGEESVTLTGNAEVVQGRQTIVADQLKYYRETDRVVATGNVEIISENGDYISSDSVDVIAPSQIGTLTNSEFKLAESLTRDDGVDTLVVAARGSAETLNLEGEGVISMQDATYTTCPEGSNAVAIKAANIELDDNAGVGVARNATVRFYGIPLVYLPYISFPINDERKTGLLIPSFGNDEDSGSILKVPWYWNIAKNQDATISANYYSERGVQLTGEYRRQTLNSQTLIYAEVLPDDDEFGEDRDLLSIQHLQTFNDNLTGSINYNDVSDASYFNDLSNDVSRFSASFVPRTASLSYRSQYFNVSAAASEYQIVDPAISEARQPYEQLPKISFSTNLPSGPWGTNYGVTGSYTNFASDFLVEGTRTAVAPYVNLPLRNIWGYVTPQVTIESRSYSLDNVEEGGEESPSFTVPVFSLDAGIALEKNTSWFGQDALHTLQPRALYVYAPSEDQSDVPDFDTGVLSLNSLYSIYSTTRFSGQDRVGDMNQITVGFTSEISGSETGDRLFTASVGQLFILEDLEQNLTEDTVIESGLGDLLASFQLGGSDDWSLSGFVRYDHDESEIENLDLRVGYSPKEDSRKRISVGYYLAKNFLNDNDTDQVTIHANWPITDRWSFFGNERYSFEDSESLSTTLGVEYDGCCWKIRFITSENTEIRGVDDKERFYFVELELNSIGTIGQSAF